MKGRVRFSCRLAGLCALLMAVLAQAASAGSPGYSIQPLDVDRTVWGPWEMVNDINNHGQVVGELFRPQDGDEDEYKIVIWRQGHIDGLAGYATDELGWEGASEINDRGQVVGWAEEFKTFNGAIWEKGPGRVERVLIPTFYGFDDFVTGNSFAYDINESSQVLGKALFDPKGGEGPENWHYFLWENGAMTDLGPEGAYDINNAGYIVGEKGIRTPDGQWTDIGGTALVINDAMKILGVRQAWSDDCHCWVSFGRVWTEEGGWVEIGGPGSDMNNHGQVIGEPGLWMAGRGWTSLIDLINDGTGAGWQLSGNVEGLTAHAAGINDRGQIAGIGFLNGEQEGFLLNPQWDAIVSSDYGYYLDTTLGAWLSLEYWFDALSVEPLAGRYIDALFSLDIQEKETTGDWASLKKVDAYYSSTDWERIMIAIPEDLRGISTQLRFVLSDIGPDAYSLAYLRNVASVPVPEPATIILFGCGLVGIAALGRKRLGRKRRA